MTDSIRRIMEPEGPREDGVPWSEKKMEDQTELLSGGDRAALEVAFTRIWGYMNSLPPGGEVQLSDASEVGILRSGEEGRCGIVLIEGGMYRYLIVEDDFPTLYLPAGEAWTKYVPRMMNGVQLLAYHFEAEGRPAAAEQYLVWVDGEAYIS